VAVDDSIVIQKNERNKYIQFLVDNVEKKILLVLDDLSKLENLGLELVE
jgi:hypothetical protein